MFAATDSLKSPGVLPAMIALALFASLGCGEAAAPDRQAADDQAAAEDAAADPAAPETGEVMPPSPPIDWPLSCDLEVPKTVRRGEKIELIFTLHHQGPRPLWVLPWQTPIEGLVSSPFLILRGKRPVAFKGRAVKRGMPKLEEYREIPPLSSQRYTVDLASAYDFQGPGRYTVAFDSLLFDVADDKAALPRTLDLLQSFELDCPTVQFEIL